MRILSIVVLTLLTLIFAVEGFNVMAGGVSALHQILGYMCLGFAGLFVGLIGVMCPPAADDLAATTKKDDTPPESKDSKKGSYASKTKGMCVKCRKIETPNVVDDQYVCVRCEG